MSATQRPTVRMPRLATAAIGLGAAACFTLTPGAAFAAAHGQPAGSPHAHPAHAHSTSAHSNHQPSSHQSSNHAATRLHDHRWQAQADPDGTENGGVDQPGGAGGVNTEDQDGNNGSGNDSDCEDDNRGRGIPGHCKSRPDHTHHTDQTAQADQADVETGETGFLAAETPEQSGATLIAVPGEFTGSQVMAPFALPGANGAAPRVSGTSAPATATESASSGVLPNTGADAGLLWLGFGGVIALGAGARTLTAQRIR